MLGTSRNEKGIAWPEPFTLPLAHEVALSGNDDVKLILPVWSLFVPSTRSRYLHVQRTAPKYGCRTLTVQTWDLCQPFPDVELSTSPWVRHDEISLAV